MCKTVWWGNAFDTIGGMCTSCLLAKTNWWCTQDEAVFFCRGPVHGPFRTWWGHFNTLKMPTAGQESTISFCNNDLFLQCKFIDNLYKYTYSFLFAICRYSSSTLYIDYIHMQISIPAHYVTMCSSKLYLWTWPTGNPLIAILKP